MFIEADCLLHLTFNHMSFIRTRVIILLPTLFIQLQRLKVKLKPRPNAIEHAIESYIVLRQYRRDFILIYKNNTNFSNMGRLFIQMHLHWEIICSNSLFFVFMLVWRIAINALYIML